MIAAAQAVSLQALQADVCVVGGGPAGISLALACAEAGLEVLLLESGGWRADAAAQALGGGEVADPALHPPVEMYRRRGLGGASAVWGGRCVPMEAVEVEKRPWLGQAGWPVRHGDLLRFYRGAHDLLDLGALDYDAGTAVAGGMRPMLPGFAGGAVCQDRIERFSPPTHFGAAYRRRMARCATLRVLLDATCTEIGLGVDGRQVAKLTCRARGGLAFSVRARAYVLAMGGVEIPRLLLASNRQAPCGVGNRFGLVGRYYTSHLAGTVGRFTPAPGVRVFHGYEQSAEGVYCRRRLSIAGWAQRDLAMGSAIARLHHPPIADPAHRTGAFSALYLARRLLPAEYVRQLEGPGPVKLLPHVLNVAGDLPGTAAFAWDMARRRLLARRRFPSLAVPPRSGCFTLDLHAEQLPNPDSRITLAHAVDRFGVPMPRVDWRSSSGDAHTVTAAVTLFAMALEGGGLDTVALDPDEILPAILGRGAYGGHHLGTTRMAESPREGVVNANCQVHGLENLFIAGGAVFPTSGQANPTLTIVALALRLAEHVTAILRAQPVNMAA